MRNYNQNEVYSQQILNPLTYGVVSRPIAYTHDIFIDKELVQPLDWRLELDTIRNASPNDIVNLRINCPGGSDMVMGAFVKAIAECQGHVVGHIEHTCASAATIIFFLSSTVNSGTFDGFSITPTTNLSQVLAALFIKSKCPQVNGSKEPA